MGDFFAEMWVVFSHSTRTQLAVAFGLVSFGSLLLLGVSNSTVLWRR